MDETYNLKAVVLNRRPFNEGDGLVTIYSLERGRLDLVVRGAKKIKSKLAGHLEPFNLVDIMAVRGRRRDYVGAAVSRKCRPNLKSELKKLTAAGQAVKIFDKLIKPGVADEALFELLEEYLEALNSKKGNSDFLKLLFIFKFLCLLGHKPELYNCVNCGGKITPERITFDLARGGLICTKCSAKHGLTIRENSVKLLRLAEKSDFKKLNKIKIEKEISEEIGKIINNFFVYHV